MEDIPINPCLECASYTLYGCSSTKCDKFVEVIKYSQDMAQYRENELMRRLADISI
jgi:hypothetical protein